MKKYTALAFMCITLLFSCAKPKDDAALRARFLTDYIDAHKSPPAVIHITNEWGELARYKNDHMDKLMALGFTQEALGKADTVNFSKLYKGNRIQVTDTELKELSEPGSGWHKFLMIHPNGYYYFSHPVLNKTHDRIIIAYGYLCGDRCGEGRLELYKKTEKGWILEEVLSSWIS